jgi:hypothetical protein
MNILQAAGVSPAEYWAKVKEVDELASFLQLTPYDRHELWKEQTAGEFFHEWPVDIGHFVTDPYYIGSDLLVRLKIKEFLSDFWGPDSSYELFVLIGGLGVGKGLALDTPLPTADGWTTMGEVEVGDQILDEAGLPTEVLWASRVHHKRCFRVTFDDGADVVCDEDHLWQTISRPARRAICRRGDKDDWRMHWEASKTLQPSDLIATATNRGQRNHHVPTTQPLNLPERDLPVPPYVMGAWLGDGTTTVPAITCADMEIVDAIRAEGWVCSRRPSQQKGAAWTYGLWPADSPPRNTGQGSVGGATVMMREMGLLTGPKRIPAQYLRASVDQRLRLLQGIMDTDGFLIKPRGGECGIDQAREGLAQDVLELVRTLGWKVRWRKDRTYLNGRDVGPRWRISFTPDRNVFTIPRKADNWKPGARTLERHTARVIASVVEVPSVATRCITVDSPRSLFLAGQDMIPTHNSFSASLCLAYALHQLGCMRAPQKYLNRFPGISLSGDASIVMMNASAAGQKQASKVVYGEGLALDTPLPTPEGWVTMGDVEVGTRLFSEQGEPCEVTFVSEDHHKRCYRITMSDRTSFVVDEAHRFAVITRAKRAALAGSLKTWKDAWDQSVVLQAPQMSAKLTIGDRKDRNYCIPACGALDLPEASLPVPPYVLGVWLGDGVTVRAAVANEPCDVQIIDEIRSEGWQANLIPSTASLPAVSYGIRPPPPVCWCERPAKARGLCERHYAAERAKPDWVARGIGKRGTSGGNGALIEARVLRVKHIPSSYLRASREQRLELLKGLMDTDGFCCNGGTVGIELCDERLAGDVQELVRSLGWIVNVTLEPHHKGGVKTRHRMSFRPDTTVFRLERKRLEWQRRAPRDCIRTSARTIVSIEEVESVTTRCITVNSQRSLFLTGKAMVPTHNTFSKIEKSSWFEQNFQPYNSKSSELEFDHNIRLAPGTSQWQSALGWNLWGFIVDEAAFGIESNRADYVKELFSNLNKRRLSRFKHLGFGGLFTSPGSEGSYVELVAEEGGSWDSSTMVRRISTWEATGEMTIGSKIFLLERSEPIKVLEQYSDLIFQGYDAEGFGVAQRADGEIVRWKPLTMEERRQLDQPEPAPAA